jgi:hypothetical protein
VDLEAKIDGQEEGSEQFTGLMWASYGGHLEIVKELVSKYVSALCNAHCRFSELRLTCVMTHVLQGSQYRGNKR